MPAPDIPTLINFCKDHMTAEWSTFKKSGDAVVKPVCVYAMGGQKDLPAATVESICNCFIDMEIYLKQTIDVGVGRDSPIISHDVMVGADGSVTLFPERRVKPPPESDTNLPPPPVPGRRQKKPPTPEEAFMTGAEQISNYILDHLKRINEVSLIAGNIKLLYLILSSAILVKCRILTYKSILKVPTSKALTDVVNRCNETNELMTQHLLSYHSDLIRTSILHDIPSHDWNSDKPFEENERISTHIHMWIFYMQGIRNDLWRFASSKMADNIFSMILTDTLSLLVTRYTQIEYNEARLPQLKADIAAIFLALTSFTFCLSPSPRFLYEGKLHHSILFPIHRRMDLLLRIASLKCAPVQILAKAYSHGIHASKRTSSNAKQLGVIDSCPEWLHFFNPVLFPTNCRKLSSLPSNIAVYITLLNAALRPMPDHALLVRGLVSRDFLAVKTILKGLQDVIVPVTKGEPCKGALCIPYLCQPPLIPHSVYSSIIQIVIECCSSPQVLNQVMQSGIKESGNWDTLDRTQIWNIQRPPWHHALVQLIGTHLVVVVAQVLLSVPQLPPAQAAHPSQVSIRLEHHLSAWTLQLLQGVEGVADTIPPSIIHIAHTINAMLPPTIKPVGGHVISQLVVSALYSIVNSRSSLDHLNSDGPVSDGQWDMMISVGERLCSLHQGNYDVALKKMTDALLLQLSVLDDDEGERLDDYSDEDVIETVSQQMADQVLATLQGQHSMGMVWKYLQRNMSWISDALKAPSLLPLAPGAAPPSFSPRMSFSEDPEMYNPLIYNNRLLFTYLNQSSLLKFECNYESILDGDLWLPTDMIQDLIKRRPEFDPETSLEDDQADSVKKLKSFFKRVTIKTDLSNSS